MFVVGCHRSGTSLLASLLRDALTLETQSAEGDLEIALDNPRGFYESRRLKELNDELLKSIGCAWDRPPLLPPNWSPKQRIDQFCALRSSFMEQALSTGWVDKDPRLCLTHAAFAHILLRRVALAVIVRDPLEVATSLYLRNAIPLERGLSLWFIYNHHLAFHLQDGDQIFDYQSLHNLKTSKEGFTCVLTAINDLLRQTGQPPLQEDRFEAIALKRVAPELNRSANSLPAMAAADLPVLRLLPVCEEAIAQWRRSSDPISGWKEAFGSIPFVLSQVLSQNNWYGGLPIESHPTSTPSKHLQQQQTLKAQEQEIAQLRERLAAIESSSSWQLTRPLRRLGDLRKS